MSAERFPHTRESGLAGPLAWATGQIVRRPRAVLLAAGVVAAVSLLLTLQYLEFHTNRLDLLNPTDDFNRRWIAYLDEFGREDDAVVVVEAKAAAGRDEVVAAIDDLALSIDEQRGLFDAVLYQRDMSKIRGKALHFAARADLEEVERFLGELDPILAEGNWQHLNLAALSQATAVKLAQAPHEQQAAAGAALDRFLAGLAAAVAEQPQYESPWPARHAAVSQLEQLDDEYLLSNGGRLGLVLLRVKESEGRLDRGTQAIDSLRSSIGAVQRRHPAVDIGLTGMPVLENDEMRASQNDMLRASLLSLAGVACLFVAGFGGIRHPLMTVAALLLAMAWSFGYVTLVVGHLNILSMSFGVILIGLGIDFGIHYVARYLQLRKTIEQSGPALVEAAASVGPGIVTGGLTTALAFCTAAMTRFTGVAELGVIAGGGILLCIVGALFVLPAMIQMSDSRRKSDMRLPTPVRLDALIHPVLRFPRRVLLAALLITAVIGAGALHVRYDHNLLNLQPKGIESVRVEERLLNQSDRSVWFALSIADTADEVKLRKARFEALDSVERVDEIASLLPPRDDTRIALIERIARRLAMLPEQAPQLRPGDVSQLSGALSQASQLLAQAGNQFARQQQTIAWLQGEISRIPADELVTRLGDFQQRSVDDLWERLQTLQSIADSHPPTIDDVPPGLAARFVGKHGRHLMRVYARGDVWDMDSLTHFVGDISAVDSNITGHPVQTFHASQQMQHSYIHAAIYSLLAVLIVLIIDFRSIRHSLLALLPMGLGLLQMFGLLGIFDIPLNPANMIVLPLILGIGIDDGVHVVHDYRRQKGRFRLSSSTATAVLITSATTIAGFGSMMLVAQHQGLRSLGQVLTIGVLCCLGTSLVILPALLALISWNRDTSLADDADSGPNEADNGPHAETIAFPQPTAPLVETGDSGPDAEEKPLIPLRRRAV